MENRAFAVLNLVLAGFALQGLSACDTGSDNEQVVIDTTSMTQIDVPNILRSVTALETEALLLSVSVNDEVEDLERGEDDIWRGLVEVPRNQLSEVVVEWSTRFGTTDLKLAEERKSTFVGGDATTVNFDGIYNTDFDFDNDRISNLDELSQNRSPTNDLDVFINSDGAFYSGLTFPSSGVCGERIPIEVVTQQPAEDDLDAPVKDFEGWWCAILKSELIDADGNEVPVENIEITVNVMDTQIHSDSIGGNIDAGFQDDSVEIFIDGNNSKLSTYDGQDDFQFRFGVDGIVISARPRAPVPENLLGEVTLFDGGYELVATIPLAQVGINSNTPFGLNIEINDDDDGENRDYKYSWIGTPNLDISFRDPSTFGTSQFERR